MGCVLIVHNEYRYRGGESVVADTEAALLASHGWTVERYTRGYDELPTAAPLKMLLDIFLWYYFSL